VTISGGIIYGTFSGSITGTITGSQVIGDISGRASGLTGTLAGSQVSGNIAGNAASITGTITGSQVTGNIAGNAASITGSITGSQVSGNIAGNAASITGSITGSQVSGNIAGNAASITGSITGSQVSGNIAGNAGGLTGSNLSIPTSITSRLYTGTVGPPVGTYFTIVGPINTTNISSFTNFLACGSFIFLGTTNVDEITIWFSPNTSSTTGAQRILFDSVFSSDQFATLLQFSPTLNYTTMYIILLVKPIVPSSPYSVNLSLRCGIAVVL